MTLPKNQQTRQRGQTLGEAGADEPFGFEPKPMLDERDDRNLLGGDGLRGPDKSQGELRDVDVTRGSGGDHSEHQNAQHGADVRGQPSRVQQEEALPEGLRRKRKGPYDKNVGRAEEAPRGRGRLRRD
jgi:hypothetical protein